MILIDGAAVGGFNVIDVEGLCRRLGIPVVTVTRRKPDLAAIQRALRRRFEDWEGRWRVLTKLPLETIAKGSGRLHVAYAGATREEVRQALAITTIRGTIPEPLRIAHLIAAAIVRGESRGRA